MPTRISSLFATIACMVLFAVPLQAHNELMASFIIEQYENQYFVRAVLEKQNFIRVLRKEGDCPAAQMLGECGKKYVLEHFNMKINGLDIELEKVNQEIRKENIHVLFKVRETIPNLKKIAVESDYMFAYNDHSIIRVLVVLKDEPVSYNLNPQRSALTYYHKP